MSTVCRISPKVLNKTFAHFLRVENLFPNILDHKYGKCHPTLSFKIVTLLLNKTTKQELKKI